MYICLYIYLCLLCELTLFEKFNHFFFQFLKFFFSFLFSIEERRRNLRRLGRSGNWSSFVEDLTARFPLRHPINLNTQDRLLIRIGDAKVRRNLNITKKRLPFNILATKGETTTTLPFNMKGE